MTDTPDIAKCSTGIAENNEPALAPLTSLLPLDFENSTTGIADVNRERERVPCRRTRTREVEGLEKVPTFCMMDTPDSANCPGSMIGVSSAWRGKGAAL